MPLDQQATAKDVEEPFRGTSWFSQQTDEYLFNWLSLILQSGDTKLAQLVRYNSLLDQCYTHFYISQETSCLAQTECWRKSNPIG